MEGWSRTPSPFHKGEQELHKRLGISERQEEVGRRIMRPAMPDQHRSFFHSLPFVIMGSVDKNGAPWASFLAGAPGFVQTASDTTMRINALPPKGDPMGQSLLLDAPVSLLGIEPHSRRRNRANLRITDADKSGFEMRLVMSFGNCPQYIQARHMNTGFNEAPTPIKEELPAITDEVADWIGVADTFFVASHNDQDDPDTVGGVDVNHRGGKPGFVKVRGNTLTIPDFKGNNAFNTLGNFVLNPRGGLLFVDFTTGDILQMTGTVDVLFDEGEDITGFEGAQRIWRFQFEKGHILRNAVAADWTFDSFARQLEQTGEWQS